MNKENLKVRFSFPFIVQKALITCVWAGKNNHVERKEEESAVV